MGFRHFAVVVAALSTCGCYGVTSKTTPLGGGWSIETQTMTGSEMSHSKKLLRRGGTVVEDWIDHERFFPPDCVIYRFEGEDHLLWRAACGDRARIQLPSWVIEVRDDGPWGGYLETPRPDGRTDQRWSRLPLDRVVAVAQQQGRFFSLLGWRPSPSIPDFERTYITLIGNPPPPDVPLDAKKEPQDEGGDQLCPGGTQMPGIGATNDDQLAVSQLFDIVSIEVWAVGSDFKDRKTLEEYMRAQLRRRPRQLLRFNPWPPDESKTKRGMSGEATLRGGRLSAIEVIGQRMCIIDKQGDVWWFSVATDDVWPGP